MKQSLYDFEALMTDSTPSGLARLHHLPELLGKEPIGNLTSMVIKLQPYNGGGVIRYDFANEAPANLYARDGTIHARPETWGLIAADLTPHINALIRDVGNYWHLLCVRIEVGEKKKKYNVPLMLVKPLKAIEAKKYSASVSRMDFEDHTLLEFCINENQQWLESLG
jgi:hypothetical protein